MVKTKKQFAVYDSDTSVTLNQGQGHKIWYEVADPKQGFNNAKFEKLCLKSVHEKANNIFFGSNQQKCQLSPLNMCES